MMMSEFQMAGGTLYDSVGVEGNLDKENLKMFSLIII